MSNWSQRSQCQPETYSNGYGTTNEHNDPQDRVLSQPYPSPNKHDTVSLTINLNLITSACQQLRETNVTVNLFDCIQCSIRILRCEVEQDINSSNNSTQTDFTRHEGKDLQENEEEQGLLSSATVEINVNHQIQELRQEQENVS